MHELSVAQQRVELFVHLDELPNLTTAWQAQTNIVSSAIGEPGPHDPGTSDEVGRESGHARATGASTLDRRWNIAAPGLPSPIRATAECASTVHLDLPGTVHHDFLQHRELRAEGAVDVFERPGCPSQR